MKRGERNRLRWALFTSAGLHGGVIALAWALAMSAPPAPPKMRVYAVDIVSPPPQLAGEFNPGNGGEPLLEPDAAAEPEPEPEPAAPEPEPVEAPPAAKPAQSDPAPAPTRAKPPAKEPSPKPAATSKPAAAKPTATAAKPAAKPATPAARPAAKPPTKVAGGGEGGGSGASRGANPDAASSGGEGLDIHLKGAQCPSPDYCANIIRQLYRYFRPPGGGSSEEAEVFFYINRDGSTSDIRVLGGSGSFRFRSAAMEAVEQAGLNHAFGSLPGSFSVDRLPVSFFFRPAR